MFAVQLKRQGNLAQEWERYVMAGDERLLGAWGTRAGMCGKGLVIPGRDYLDDATCVHEGPDSDTLDLQAGPQEFSIELCLGFGKGREEEAVQNASVDLGEGRGGIARWGNDHGCVGVEWELGRWDGLRGDDRRQGSLGN